VTALDISAPMLAFGSVTMMVHDFDVSPLARSRHSSH
jgi:hypothetical protein